jgi:flagellar basal-body rod protein FlgB
LARDKILALPSERTPVKTIHFSDWREECTHWTEMLNPLAGRIENYMDLLSTRQKLVASNIANADTPGYKTKDLDFQFEFMSRIEGLSPTVAGVPGLQVKNDGNDVNMDRETRLLAENAIRFDVASTLLKSQFKMIRSAIQEGK